MKATVIIPVKVLPAAKSRLAEYVNNEEREALVLTMLRHVLQTVKAADDELEIVVVSTDQKVYALATSLGIKTIPEKIIGHNHALRYAANQLDPSLPLLTISADLPLVKPHDINHIFLLGKTNDVVLAASKEGTGTNALLLRKPLLLPYLFGTNSLGKFVTAAEKQHLKYSIYNSASIAFDVDTIDDLKNSEFLHKYHFQLLR
jgi:2-phospho-L-lactate guanylyltransferase